MDRLEGHTMKTEYRKGWAPGYGNTTYERPEQWGACQCGHAERMPSSLGSSGTAFRLFRLEHQVQVLAQA